MKKALSQCERAMDADEVPVGAVLFHEPSQKILYQGHNRVEKDKNPLHHAEFLALQEGMAQLGRPFLDDCTLYVTLEPCAFCASACILVHLKRVFFGAYNPKTGALDHGPKLFDTSLDFRPQYVGGGV